MHAVSTSVIGSLSSRAVAAVAAALIVGACGSGATPTDNGQPGQPPVTATSGWLTVQLTTPNGIDGAVQLALSGPGIDTVRVVTPYSGLGKVTAGAVRRDT